MLSTNNITMQFGSKPLFENISVKFGGGNRYGLIGANGCGKSTFMKIMGGDLEPTGGNVSLDPVITSYSIHYTKLYELCLLPMVSLMRMR